MLHADDVANVITWVRERKAEAAEWWKEVEPAKDPFAWFMPQCRKEGGSSQASSSAARITGLLPTYFTAMSPRSTSL